MNFGKKLPLALAGFVAVGLFTSCDSARTQACQDLPAVENEAARVLAEIAPYSEFKKKKRTGRHVASVTVPPSSATQEDWFSWAEGTLKRSQVMREGLETEIKQRRLLEPLNQTSLMLVNFHGYLSQKKYDRALKTLEQFQKSIIDFRGKLCVVEAPEKSAK